VYLVRNQVLLGVPNLHTFVALGKEFSQVQSLLAIDRVAYKFGPMLANQ
jgi:hypothetical protein